VAAVVGHAASRSKGKLGSSLSSLNPTGKLITKNFSSNRMKYSYTEKNQ
jgi:hypothetical protein